MLKTKYYRKSFSVTLSNGQKKQLWVYGKTKKEAEAKLQKLKTEHEMGLHIINTNTLFSRWFAEYIDSKRNHVTAGTIKAIESVINIYFMPTLGAMKLSDIKKVHIENCLKQMEGKSYSYINKAVIYINNIFTEAYENDLIKKIPTHKLKKPNGKKGTRRALNQKIGRAHV